MERTRSKQKDQKEAQWFRYDVIPHNIRWKQEKLNKKYSVFTGISTSFLIMVLYFFFTKLYVSGEYVPLHYIFLEAVIIEIIITVIIRIMVVSNRKYIQKIFDREELKNLKGKFYTEYMLIENMQGRQTYFYYKNLSSAVESAEAFFISDKEQELHLEKRYLTRDDMLFIRNQFIHYCKKFQQFYEENEARDLIFKLPMEKTLNRNERYRKAVDYVLSTQRTAYGGTEWTSHVLAGAFSAIIYMCINLPDSYQPILRGMLVVFGSIYIFNFFYIFIKAKKILRNPKSTSQTTIHIGKNEIILQKGEHKEIQKYNKVKKIIEGDTFFKIGTIYLWKERFGCDEWVRIRDYLRKYVSKDYIQIYVEESFWKRYQITFWCTIIGFVFMGIFMNMYKAFAENREKVSPLVVESDTINERSEQGTGMVKDKKLNFVFTPNKGDLYLNSEVISMADCYSSNVVNQTSRFYIEGGILYGMSVNANGELGMGNTEEDITAKGFYRTHELVSNVKHVAQGTRFMVYLNHKDELWGTGLVPGIGQSLRPVLIMENVSFVDCSDEGMIILKNDGTVWCAGSLKDSNGNELSVYDGIVQVLEQVKYVTAGKYVMAAIGENHTLWMWGDNRHGQCGGIEQGTPVFAAPTEIKRAVKMIWLDKLAYRDYEEYPLYASDEEQKENYCTYIQLTDGNMYACGETLDADSFIPVVVEERDDIL